MEKTKRREVSVRALISLRGCGDTLPFFDLSLKPMYEGAERALFMRQLLQEAVDSLAKGIPKSRMHDLIQGFFDEHYEESFFDFKAQFKAGKEKDMKKICRMVDYIYDNGFTVLCGKSEYQVPLNQIYKGQQLGAIRDYADMIIRTPQGKHIAVNFSLGEPEYSYRAKKEINKVENSIELLSLYLGFCEKYGEDMEVAVFYLKNKDDKGDEFIKTYDHKQGKNIIHWSYGTRIAGWQRLEYAVSLNAEITCAGCNFRTICKMQRFISCDSEISNPPILQKNALPQPTEEQKQVVAHTDGPMCVVAVPGAGKTFSLVARLKHLIEIGVDARKILFVTFTQKAAMEIKERIARLLEKDSDQPDIFTFNALGYSLLRQYPEALGGAFRLAGKVDQFRMIEEALKRVPEQIKGVSYDGITGEFGLLNHLWEDFKFIEEKGQASYRLNYCNKDVDGILAVYQEYRNIFVADGYITYDDQIVLANKLLESRPEVLEECREKYQYIMVDEYQDISAEQVKLIYSLAAHGNLVVVGDDDQNIYSWRGGSSRYMLDFHKDWPGAIRITMEDNFRSVNTVLETANPVISKNPERFFKTIRPHMFDGRRPVFLDNITTEDLWDIIRGKLIEGYQPGDIAIIARKNKELFEIEKALTPYVEVLPSRRYLIEDAVFVAIYDVLMMYYRSMNDYSFYRFLRFMEADSELPGRRNKGITLYEDLCRKEKILAMDYTDIQCLPAYEARKEDSRLLYAGYILVSAFKTLQYSKSAQDAIDKLFRLLFRGETKHTTVEALCRICDERLIDTAEGLFSFMTAMIRYRDETELEYPKNEKRVNLITAHCSKGKEYPVVIIYNVESYHDVIEDRCLLYVAMTRAKKVLYLTNGPQAEGELVSDFIGTVDTCIMETAG